MVAILYFAVLAVLSIWALFWIVRLGVRYGMNDALHANRELFGSNHVHETQRRDG